MSSLSDCKEEVSKEPKSENNDNNWTRLTLSHDAFSRCNTLANLKELTGRDTDVMYIDGEFDTCLIRNKLEFQAWKAWNTIKSTPVANVYVWHRRELKKETKQDIYLSIDLKTDEDAASLVVDSDSNTSNEFLPLKQTKSVHSCRIIAEHPLQIVSRSGHSYVLKQRWTIQNTGATDWSWAPADLDDTMSLSYTTKTSIRFVPLNLPQQAVISSSLPFHCASKATAHVHVVFRHDLNDDTTFYFQCARSEQERKDNSITQQCRLFGPRFSVRIHSISLKQTALVNDVLEQLKVFHLCTPGTKQPMPISRQRILVHQVVSTMSLTPSIEDVVCRVVDRCS
jgi:hypothetical protein